MFLSGAFFVGVSQHVRTGFAIGRARHIDLLILADISGSVRYAAELTLALAAGARDCFRRVSSFVYIDHLTEADFEQGHLVTSAAIDFDARSDFGRVLAELWERRNEWLNRQTLIVIIGDARNNRRPARAELLRQVAGERREVTPERVGAAQQRNVGNVLVVGDPNDPRDAVRRAELVRDVEALEAKDPATAGIPIIIVTTKDQETDRVWGLRQGAKDYVTKPVAENELIAKIKTVLGG